jgi:hypothetical protein
MRQVGLRAMNELERAWSAPFRVPVRLLRSNLAAGACRHSSIQSTSNRMSIG